MPPKTIVLLADGTGNSAAKLFKTNVWRLYRALDQRDPPPGEQRQIACYHDGVGTSTFKPLAILGGVFGVGLKRNVLEIYAFLCRNYEPGDRIYAYGFSRGAFTVRVLAGLVITQGVLRCATELELERYATDAYRNYRRRYKLPIFGYKDKTARADPTQRVGLVDLLRDLRDGVIKLWRRAWRSKQYDEIARLENLEIDFIGVWDTVAAYGLPIDELTRGIDEWVWPLSMPNYRLSERVLRARHALSLDDERDTFQPLLWDELEEPPTVPGAVPRLQQVWFAGAHSDVGGGYADDTASYVALKWMMDESEKPVRTGDHAGLRFLPTDLQEFPIIRNDCAPLHDSRRGVGSYYRYQPRKIIAKLDPPDPSTLMMQDPNRKGRGFLRRVQVHASVFDRIRHGGHRYAPIVLPPDYEVVAPDGTAAPKLDLPPPAPQRPPRQEWVFDDVWRRRVNYFTTVGVSLLLALLPVLQTVRPPSTCVGPQCLLSPVITTLGAVLPGFVQPWITAFAATPGIFLSLVFIILLLIARSWALTRRIEDGMRELWSQALNLPLGAEGPATKAGMSSGPPDTWICRLRRHRSYQRFFQLLKWRVLPGFFGFTVLVGGLLLIAALVLVAVQRTRLVLAERSGALCAAAATRTQPAGARFPTSDPCWRSSVQVEKGRRYRITLLVTQEWVDKSIRTSPLGFESDRFPWYARPAVLMRRSLNGRWFQPMLKIIPAGGRGGHTQLLDVSCACGSGPVYTAEFTAPRSGELALTVNDAAIGLFGGPTRRFYDNNQGEAEVRIEPLDAAR